MFSRSLIVLLACAWSLAACSVPMGGVAPTPDIQAPTVRTGAAELAHLNEHLVDLIERIQPGLVRIRPGREAAKEDGAMSLHHPGLDGTGFLIDSGGAVVTAAHVLSGVEAVEVELSDGHRFTGRVIGADTRADLALVKIDGSVNLPALAFGDSDQVRVGEFVLALGHPFGLDQAVSFGIVSRKGPPPSGGVPGFNFIHTDASVNPGYSGGPVVNMAGEVVGVNSWAARNGSMGVAVPSSLVKLVLPQLVAYGRVVKWDSLSASIAETRPEDLESATSQSNP